MAGKKAKIAAETVNAPHQLGIVVVTDRAEFGRGMPTAVSCRSAGREAAAAALLTAINADEIAGAQMWVVGEYIQFTALPGREQDLPRVITRVTHAVTEHLMTEGADLTRERVTHPVFPVPTVYSPAGSDYRTTRNDRGQTRTWRADEATNKLHYATILGMGFDWRFRVVEVVVQLRKNGELVQTHCFLRHFTLSVNENGEVETKEVARRDEVEPVPFYNRQSLASAIKGEGDARKQARHACAQWLFHLIGEAQRTAPQAVAMLKSQQQASAVANRLDQTAKTKPVAKAARA